MTRPNHPIHGIHHVTAIAGDPQRNLDFYAGLLGMRLVKKTVNFDDPQTYHFYFGDGEGNPGSLLTFFPWPGARRGQLGAGQTSHTAFSVPANSLDYWRARLTDHGITPLEEERFGASVLSFQDPDGLLLELVASQELDTRAPWSDGPVPVEHAIRGVDSVTLMEAGANPTHSFLLGAMGFEAGPVDGPRRRYVMEDGLPGQRIDVLERPGAGRGRVAGGSVHHVAFRLRDDDSQRDWQHRIADHGTPITEVKDRDYFRSVYFREPGGVLFELATDPPGFTVDEPVETLGHDLQLPTFLEKARAEIERALPTVHLPTEEGS